MDLFHCVYFFLKKKRFDLASEQHNSVKKT